MIDIRESKWTINLLLSAFYAENTPRGFCLSFPCCGDYIDLII